MQFNNTLHGVRGLAALLVLLYHWHGPFPAAARAVEKFEVFGIPIDLGILIRMGWIGVDWFFVLSGYVLASTLWERRLTILEIMQFWKRRVLRIFPALWLQLVVLVPILYAVGVFSGFNWEQFFKSAVLWLRPLPQGVRGYNGVYWTLVVELSFYLFLPFLLLLFRRTNIWFVIFLAALVQLYGQFGWLLVPVFDHAYFVLRSVYPFLAGVQLAFIVGLALNYFRLHLSDRQRYLWLLIFIFVYFSMLWLLDHYKSEIPRGHWTPLIWRMTMALIIAGIIFAILNPLRGIGWLSSGIMVWLGDISYGIYLWHLPVQSLTARLLPGPWSTPMGSVAALLLTTAITFAVASLSYYLVERPILNRFAGRRRVGEGGATR